MKSLVIIWLAVLVSGIGTVLYIDTGISAAAADGLNCQYPGRSSNPPGGCDNSDPCDPANIKGEPYDGSCSQVKCAGYPNGRCESLDTPPTPKTAVEPQAAATPAPSPALANFEGK